LAPCRSSGRKPWREIRDEDASLALLAQRLGIRSPVPNYDHLARSILPLVSNYRLLSKQESGCWTKIEPSATQRD
jgi:hypothetical protein